jgi:hypothetical protein
MKRVETLDSYEILRYWHLEWLKKGTCNVRVEIMYIQKRAL